MHGECANGTLRIANLGEQLSAYIQDLPRVAHLSAALGVERGASYNQLTRLALGQRRDLRTVAKETHDGALGVKVLVADELCLTHTPQDLFIESGCHGDLRKGGLLATAAALALLRKGALKAGAVNGDPALGSEFDGQVDRESIRIVQLEGNLTAERWTSGWQIIGTTANNALPCPKVGERVTEQA
jgi:hypothetical protein